MTLFMILIPVVMFDILEELNLLSGLFSEPPFGQGEDTSVLDQMSDLGYDSYNLVLNLGTLFIMIGLYILKVLVLFIVLLPLSKLWPDTFYDFYKKVKKQLFFGDLILIFLEGFMEFLTSSMILL